MLAGVTYRITLGSSRVRLTLPLENVDDVIHSSTRRTPPAPRFPGTRRPAHAWSRPRATTEWKAVRFASRFSIRGQANLRR